VYGPPLESNLEALRLAIIGKASNASIIYWMVFNGKRVPEVLTIDDPMPTTGAPMRVGCPVVHLVRFRIELAGVHAVILRVASFH
jgi:hypothetical protein